MDNYYSQIKEQIINNEITKQVKNYSINKSDLTTYYNIGKLLNDAGKHYGENIIKKYSVKLTNEFGKKYNVRYLFDMKKLYEFAKVHPLDALLNMSHYRILFSLKDNNEIEYYISQIKKRNLSKRQLQKIILEDIPSFLEELGTGFTFIKNEYKIKIGNNYNYIDLLLFNYEFNCFIVIELKTTELKKEHIGQIEIYMNYIDNNIKKIHHNKTIGIIICRKDNKFIIEYASDKRILSREYIILSC